MYKVFKYNGSPGYDRLMTVVYIHANGDIETVKENRSPTDREWAFKNEWLAKVISQDIESTLDSVFNR